MVLVVVMAWSTVGEVSTFHGLMVQIVAYRVVHMTELESSLFANNIRPNRNASLADSSCLSTRLSNFAAHANLNRCSAPPNPQSCVNTIRFQGPTNSAKNV